MTVTDTIEVRQLRAEDRTAVRRLFASSMLLGKRHDVHLAAFDIYTDLCLGWYLDVGRADAAVAEADGRVIGYALVCSDPTAQAEWVRRRLPALMGRVLWLLVTFRLDRVSRRFYWHRARDSWELWRAGSAPLHPVHAHLNVDSGLRTGTTALALRDFIDATARASGAAGWYGEMNAVEGTRARALERIGLHVVHRAPNRTMSELLGQPVSRLTVERRVRA